MKVIQQQDYARGIKAPRSVEIVDFASRAPYRPWWDRVDLFFRPGLYAQAPEWRPHGRSVKVTRRDLLGRERTGLEWQPCFISADSRMIKHSEHVKGVVAALFGYHQMTTGMLAAHIGYPAPAISAVLKPMYEAGLIERGRFMVDQWQGKLDYLYRLRADEPLERWLANLDEPDWCAVTLGMEPKEPARFVRHNLLVSELVLRLHETAAAPLQTIYGERLASNRRLLPKVPSRRDLSGDACVVREDGLRIVIELVQNQRDNDVMEKMTAWGKVLSQGSLNALGTVVVFLNACGPTVSDTDAPHGEKATSLRRCHLRALTPENLGTNKEGAARARMAIYVAAWRDWFPGDSCISTDFTHLRVCWSPDGTTWTRAALINTPGDNDIIPFAPADAEAWGHPRQVVADPATAAGSRRTRGTHYFGVPGWANGPVASTLSPDQFPQRATPAA
jgi:DNA-binding transcriptional ArsR family regulator